LRVAEHRDPRVGVPVFEGANDQARRLEPDAHEADRKPPPRSVVRCTKDPRDLNVTPDCESVAFSLRHAYCQGTHMNYAGVGTVICSCVSDCLSYRRARSIAASIAAT